MRDPDYTAFARGRPHAPCGDIPRHLGACILEYTLRAGSNNALATSTGFDDVELSYALPYDPKAPESAPRQHLLGMWENAGHARRCEGVPEPHSMLGKSFLTYKLAHSPDAALQRHIHRNCWNMEMSKSAKVRSADRERLFATHVRKARTRTHV